MANDNIAVQKLKLGIGLPNSGSIYVYAKQYDGNSRKIVAEILDSDGPISLAGNSVRLNATLPNGEKLYMDGQVEDNKATFLLTADFLALDGTAACDISVINDTGDGLLLTSSTFYIVVSQSNFDENAPGSYPSSVVVSTMLKPATATEGNIAVFDNNKNVVDSGKSTSDFAPSAENGYVAREIGTSAAYRVYAFNDTGDTSLPVINGTSTGTVEPSSGDAMVKSTNGRIRVATPIGPYHAATKKYVDDGFVAKASISTSRKIPYFSTTEDGSYFTMTGGDGSTAPTAGGIVPVMTSGKISVNTPTGDYHAANKKYVDSYVVANPADTNWMDTLTTILIGDTCYRLKDTTCLIAGTKISMADGTEKNIENVQAGDEVLSYDPSEQKLTTAIVFGAEQTGSSTDFTRYIFEDGGHLTVYYDHGYYEANKGFIGGIKQINNKKFGLNLSLSKVRFVEKEDVQYYGLKKPHYNIFTSNNLYFANGILCGFNPTTKLAYVRNNNISAPENILSLLESDAQEYEDFNSVLESNEYYAEAAPYLAQYRDAKRKVEHYKNCLSLLDYQTIKFAEGYITREELEETLERKETYRAKINEFRPIYKENFEIVENIKSRYRNGATKQSVFEDCCARDNAAVEQFRAWFAQSGEEETNDETE